MRKRKHIEKFSADGRVLWYAAALCGMLLFCLAPILPGTGAGTETGNETAEAARSMPPAPPGSTADSASTGAGAVAEVGDPVTPVFLMQGDCGEAVYRLQTQLYTLGYDVECSGVYTQKTASAVRRFQEDCGLPADGVCTASVSYAAAVCSDAADGQSAAVTEEQLCRALRGAGCYDGAEARGDGIDAQRLRNALILFQRTHGLCGSGTADYATLCALGLSDGRWGDAGFGDAAAARFDLRCRLLSEALARFTAAYPRAYDLYTLTACAAMLCNRTEDDGFPTSLDAVCAVFPGGAEAPVSGAAITARARDLLLLRAAEDALTAHLTDPAGADAAHGALYVCPADRTLPAGAVVCMRTSDFVFFR